MSGCTSAPFTRECQFSQFYFSVVVPAAEGLQCQEEQWERYRLQEVFSPQFLESNLIHVLSDSCLAGNRVKDSIQKM